MPAKIFIDAKDPPEKSNKVRHIVATHFEDIIISAQTLGELYNVLTRKNLVSVPQTRTIIVEMATNFLVSAIDTPKVLQALDISDRYQYAYWDSLIVATALLTHCQTLYSEDMHHQQVIDGKTEILNPFI